MISHSDKCIVVTGAGSGIGRGIVLRFLTEGWSVALVGRRAEALTETVSLAGNPTARIAIFPCDIGNADAVNAMAAAVRIRFGRVDALVNAAGTNIPRRSCGELSRDDYHAVLATNLNGAVYCVQAFLPGFRVQGGGTVVNINSEAGLQAQRRRTRQRHSRLFDFPRRCRHTAPRSSPSVAWARSARHHAPARRCRRLRLARCHPAAARRG